MSKNLIWMLAVVICPLVTACKGTSAGFSHVRGTLDGPLTEDSVPARVLEAMERAERYHQHDLMSDTIASVAVFSIDEADTTSTEGFGIVVTKGAVSTTFPHIRNVRQPRACYDREKGNLWLTSSQMEGTGVAVERPYLVRFGDNDIAYIAATIDPYDMQQALCQRLRYAVEGREVTLYDGDQHLVTVVVNETNMGDLYEDAVWIGEQLTYEADSDGLTVCVTPGLSFNTGLVLLYDDMPTLKVRVTLDEDGAFTLGSIKVRSDEEIITEFYRAVLGEKEMTEQMLKESLSPKVLETLWEADYDDTYSWWVFRTGQQDGPSDKSALESIKPLGDGWYRVTYTDMGTRGITDVRMDGGKISDYRTHRSTN